MRACGRTATAAAYASRAGGQRIAWGRAQDRRQARSGRHSVGTLRPRTTPDHEPPPSPSPGVADSDRRLADAEPGHGPAAEPGHLPAAADPGHWAVGVGLHTGHRVAERGLGCVATFCGCLGRSAGFQALDGRGRGAVRAGLGAAGHRPGHGCGAAGRWSGDRCIAGSHRQCICFGGGGAAGARSLSQHGVGLRLGCRIGGRVDRCADRPGSGDDLGVACRSVGLRRARAGDAACGAALARRWWPRSETRCSW